MTQSRALVRAPGDALYAAMAISSVAFFIIFTTAIIIQSHPPYDLRGYPLGHDFVNTWMSGRAALGGHPADWFDVHVYNQAVRLLFGLPKIFPLYNWSYPPDILLFTWIFGLLSYLPAWTLWSVTGFAVYYFAAAQNERRLDRLIFLAAWPAATVNLFAGQNGFFTAALMIGGLTQTEKRPILAGVLFGLLTLKPQLGLLLPLMLLLTRNWRCMAAATLTTLTLIALTTALYGAGVWEAYFHVAVPAQNHVFEMLSGRAAIALPTPFMNARALGAPIDVAWLIQFPVSVVALAAAIWTYWRRRDPTLSCALLITATFLVTPYAWAYDMIVFGWVITKLHARSDNQLLDELIVLGVWALPIISDPYPLSGIPAFSLFLMLLMARLLWRLYRDDSRLPVRKEAVSAQIDFAGAKP